MEKSPNEKENQKVFDAFDLIKFAWDKKWLLIAITFLAGITSIFVSLSMPDRFQSQVILFPAASVSIAKNLVQTTSGYTGSKGILSFGEEEDGERMLQFLNSSQVREHIMNKYELWHHYEIDYEKEKYPVTKLHKMYDNNIKFRQTEFLSLEISVMDENPEYAANIANDIASYIDSVVNKIQKDRPLEAYKIVEKEYLATQEEVEQITDSLKTLGELGIFDFEAQSEALSIGYATALSKGNTNAAKLFERKLNTLAQYGSAQVEMSEKLTFNLERLTLLKDKFTSAKVDLEQTLPQIYIVDQGQVAERKTEPKRSIIVMVSTFSAFALALLLLLIYDNVKARF